MGFDLFSGFNRNKVVGSFGISYLDEKLHGIMRGDLILIGASSGAGKSSIANNIAFYNRDKGVKIALYSLENFEDDLYMEKAWLYYINRTRQYDLSLREFACGDVIKRKDADKIILQEAQTYAEQAYKNIIIHTRETHFDLEKLCKYIKEDVEKNNVQLVILDHLDYLDKMDESDSDITHMTLLMRTIRDLQDAYKIGFVAISHLRKGQNYGKEKMIIPTMDEFIGSSNKVKESTVVCLFSPDNEYNEANPNSHLRGTFCCVRKNRFGGYDNKASRLLFDRQRNEYLRSYELLVVNAGGTAVQTLSNESRQEKDGSYGISHNE